MSNNNPINESKKALLAYKQKLLEDMQYYDKRIEEFRANHRKNCFYDDADSSDEENFFPNMIDAGPQVAQLKTQQSVLKTCLQATQELTNLTVLQSELNVLVQDPQLNGEKPVAEIGTWQEVTAECRIDLVPFTIAFYMHTPDRKFGPRSYRGLQLSLVKSSHEIELKDSVLHTLKRPSDAVEVIHSYAVGHRSRRTTLAKLANKYANSLFMEPHPEGGFILKCANLLEILWRLENKWSPLAPFHHRMKFDLEYMDESYIKIITQAHKQLLDPAIDTDERTLLLSKIINTCLEARGPIDSESDLESRQTDTQTDTEPKNKDSEVMAPPKSLPKKSKKVTPNKNINENISKEKPVPQKRSIEDENDRGKAKKVKTTEASNSVTKKNLKTKEKQVAENQDGQNKVKNNDVNVGTKKKAFENVDVAKNTKNNHKGKQINKKNNQNDVNSKSNVDNNENNKNTANIAKQKNNNQEETVKGNDKIIELKKTKSNEELKRKNVETTAVAPKKVKSSTDINKKYKQLNTNSKKTDKQKNNEENKNNNQNKNLENAESTVKNAKENPKNNDAPPKKVDKKTKMSIANDKKFDLITKKISGNIDKNSNQNVENTEKAATSKTTKDNKKSGNVIAKTNNIETKTANKPKTIQIQKNNNEKTNLKENNKKPKDFETVKTFTDKNANNNVKNKDHIQLKNVVSEKNEEKTIANKPQKIVNRSSTPKSGVYKQLPKITTKTIRNIIHKSPNAKKTINVQSLKTKISNGNTQVISGSTGKENGGKMSKIPQKKMSFNSEKILQNNALRISPRRQPALFKTNSQVSKHSKQHIKTTYIPRFMKKTAPKISK